MQHDHDTVPTHWSHASLSPWLPPPQVFSFGVLMQQMLTRCTPWERSETGGGFQVNKQFWQPVAGVPRTYTDLQHRCDGSVLNCWG